MNTAELKKALSLSKELKGLGFGNNRAVKKKAVSKPTPFKFDYEALKKPRAEVIKEKAAAVPTSEPIVIQKEFEITPELVKEIIKVMHTLPEGDKLEVSKGIRNASSFIYGGTKYQTAELMHGGSSGGTSSVTFVNNEVVAGSGTTFTLANTPTAGSVDVYALGQHLVPTTDYTISGAVITTVSSWSAGNILASYRY